MQHMTHSHTLVHGAGDPPRHPLAAGPEAPGALLAEPKFCITEMSIFALLGLVGTVALVLWAMIAAVI